MRICWQACLKILTDCHSVLLSLVRKTTHTTLFPDLQRWTGEFFSGSSTVAKVIRRSHATGVRKFCIFALISNSWLPPTPLVVSQPYGSSVESHSTALSVASGPMSSSNRHVILPSLTLVFPELVLSSGRFWSLSIRNLLEKLILTKLLEFTRITFPPAGKCLHVLWIFQRHSFSKLYWAVYRGAYTAWKCARFTTRLNSEDISLFQDVLTQDCNNFCCIVTVFI